jgi:hypothetical protein
VGVADNVLFAVKLSVTTSPTFAKLVLTPLFEEMDKGLNRIGSLVNEPMEAPVDPTMFPGV